MFRSVVGSEMFRRDRRKAADQGDGKKRQNSAGYGECGHVWCGEGKE